ncbi:unnamed protein product [Rhizoctonia solani]|uniref:RING-type domain-containing protein n=1 Tax=Rhizoctonia solani TaxID=456999 RepID=A0A8H2XCM1_9AGAM|nr:unnamed protein product [Rhizoctonia solani]
MADGNAAGDLASSKRPRDVSPEGEDYEGRVFQTVEEESQISTFSIDDEISCGICLGVLESPYTVIPCLHTFDKDCLVGWWQRNDTCPLCKTRATSGRHSFQLQAIVNHYDSKRPPHKRARADEAAGIEQRGGDNAEIYPFGVAPPAGNQLPVHEEDEEEEGDEFNDFIEDDNDDDDEAIEDNDFFNLLVGGRIVFPCAACRPGHHSGYTCPLPIPEPADAVKDFEAQDYLNGRRAISEPRRGYRRIPFEEGLHNLPGAGHILNQTERQRFLDRLTSNNITPTSATQELLRAAGHDEGDYLCTNCIETTMLNGFAASWQRKKENGEVPLPAQAPNPSDCWHGRECRTQGHNAGHAARFNHDCDPRPQGQPQPVLPPAPAAAPPPNPDPAPVL